MDYIALGKRIRSARKARSWTQAKLAEQCGISTACCGHIERGTHIPSIETLVRLCETLGVSCDAILANKKTPELTKTPEKNKEVPT